jgi:hypothetical protein
MGCRSFAHRLTRDHAQGTLRAAGGRRRSLRRCPAGWAMAGGRFSCSAEGGTCYVTVHLSFLGDDPRNHGGAPAVDVDQQLRRSLDRLTDLVAPGRS